VCGVLEHNCQEKVVFDSSEPECDKRCDEEGVQEEKEGEDAQI
jgi:hypothetical protein